MLFFWAGSKMTFMRIFPFEVRVFAYFTLKQGKKQELQQINNGSLGERAGCLWTYTSKARTLPRLPSAHLGVQELDALTGIPGALCSGTGSPALGLCSP